MLVVPAHIHVQKFADGGAARYVAHNAATGVHFAVDAATHKVIEGLRAKRPLGEIQRDAGVSEAELEALIGQLLQNGLAHRPGQSDAAPPPKAPPESRLVFFRIDLADIRPVVERAFWALRLPFTRLGVLVWALLMLTAAFSVIAEPRAFERALRSFADLSWESAAALFGVIICLKVWHELGHATALRYFAGREGFDPGPIRAGLAVFACFPFPYTDATAAWRIQSRYRRAGIGMAGIYFESWAAAVAALGWAWVRPGETQTVLFQILAIAGFSTLLFNLNPLIRLDGYFVFQDLIGFRNLAGRASRAAQATGLRAVSKARSPIERPLLVYWALAFVYRCTIFIGVFWLAYQIDPRLAWAPAAIGGALLFGRPLWTMATRARQAGFRPVGLAAVATGVGAVGWLLFVPVADAVHVDGFIVRHLHTPVQVRESARLSAFAEAGAAGPAATLESPDLALQIARLSLDRDRIAGALRAAGSRDPERLRLLQAEADRTETQLRETRARAEALTVRLAKDALWQPDEARVLAGAWVAPYANRRLGQIARPASPLARAYLDQSYSDLGDRLRPGDAIELRPVAKPSCVEQASMRAIAPVEEAAETQFRLDAAIASDGPCLAGLPEGSAVILRLKREDASAARQMYNYFRRLALNRLPVDLVRPE